MRTRTSRFTMEGCYGRRLVRQRGEGEGGGKFRLYTSSFPSLFMSSTDDDIIVGRRDPRI